MIREQFIIQSAPDRQVATRPVSFLLKAKYGIFIHYQWLVDVDVYPVDHGAKIGSAQCNQTICCKVDNRAGEMHFQHGFTLAVSYECVGSTESDKVHHPARTNTQVLPAIMPCILYAVEYAFFNDVQTHAL